MTPESKNIPRRLQGAHIPHGDHAHGLRVRRREHVFDRFGRISVKIGTFTNRLTERVAVRGPWLSRSGTRLGHDHIVHGDDACGPHARPWGHIFDRFGRISVKNSTFIDKSAECAAVRAPRVPGSCRGSVRGDATRADGAAHPRPQPRELTRNDSEGS
jgi:hypothetical protein